jgi:hypothetical protein
MTHKEILELIKKAGFDVELASVQDGTSLSYKLATLVASAEREACAELIPPQYFELRDRIRARGQA